VIVVGRLRFSGSPWGAKTQTPAPEHHRPGYEHLAPLFAERAFLPNPRPPAGLGCGRSCPPAKEYLARKMHVGELSLVAWPGATVAGHRGECGGLAGDPDRNDARPTTVHRVGVG
jgi:hypothetical protein